MSDKKIYSDPLMLPCLRGSMGDWVYYVALMPFGQLADRVKLASEIHSHEGLKDLLQRALTNRSEGIADYLCSQKQHFFNAIILGIYEGDPEWTSIDIGGNAYVSDDDIPELVREGVGVISLSGKEKIFARDGQHRIEGIKEAVKRKKGLSAEEQTVVFVAHKNTKPGKVRTRRLFSSLNRYAKPVKLAEIIALDEDDVTAIVTRELLENHPLLSIPNIIHISKSKTVPRTNSACITSIHSLYENLDNILSISTTNWNGFKKIRPSDADVISYFTRGAEFWDLLIKYFTPLKSYHSPTATNEAEPYRNKDGGHLLFRPKGLGCITRVVKHLAENGMSLNDAIKLVETNVPMDLAHTLWSGLLWESGKKRIITSKTNENIAVKVMLKYCGQKLSDYKTSELSLKGDYCSATNKSLESFKWPKA